MKLDKTVSSILVILLVAAVIATVYIIVNPSPGEKFTELYILGAGDKAGNYPTNLSVNEIGNITVGLVNHEQSTTTYNLVETLNGVTLSNQNITLSNNETKQINFSFQPTQTGNNQTLEFKLYKLPNTDTVYRSVFLYVNVM
ncbi:DUF1616 domain-containing protein [Methanobacterium spitsbergense]|uniref:DUF1616 domain-containing protein n=1 Tax=Methanobacterium spitsbergense TaxID=2874285 RepID=A0A8T5UWC3_9EURY|nr:DUF1616 domain-containing protein [Methanobacterium spitsbergense]MBZ2166577.1 DUF1616 domain-containing protein [Methanobacterium spitsbergense]